jgi:hypothetical protein
MRLTHIVRAGAAALALAGAAVVGPPVLAQSGAPAGDAPVFPPFGAGTVQSLFPLTAPAMPTQLPSAAPQISQLGGFQDRVRTRSTNIPDRDSLTLINLGTPHVNATFGGIGAGAGTALGINLTTAEKIDGVELYGDAMFSFSKYRQFEVGAILGNETNKGEVRFRYTRRVSDNFFGLGPFSDENPVLDPSTGLLVGGETNFDHEARAFQAGFSHMFTRRLTGGVYVDLTSSSIYEGDDDNDASIFERYFPYFPPLVGVFPTVTEPRFTAQLPGLNVGSKIFSYGAYLEYDHRDYDFGLTRGFYGYGRIASHEGIDEVFYDYGWTKLTIDMRAYVPVYKEKTSVALRYFTDLNNPKGGDVIPFYHLARLGGASTLRGFQTLRFYGSNSILFQAEVRQNVMIFEDDVLKGVDINVFADAGQVWGRGFEPQGFNRGFLDRGDTFKFDNYEVDVGVGATVRYGKNFAVRFDYAHSNETDRVRLSFTRGF